MGDLRITGMATGMDTDATIKKMMKPYNMRVDKMKQDRQVVAWRQELYRDILSDTAAIKNTYLYVAKPDTNMLRKSNYDGFDVTAVGAGASATASTGAVAGNYEVNVTKLATADKINGIAITTPSDILNKYITKLSDFTILNGETLNFSYNDANGKTQNKELKLVPPTIPVTPSTISENATISQLIDAVNKCTDGNVKLNFSELTRTFSMESSQIGKSSSLVVTGNILTKLNLPATTEPGTEAEVKITPPGMVPTAGVNVKKTSNNFSIDGVNYTLTQKGITTLTVTGNSQKTCDKIKEFIGKYNELVEKVSGKADEKKQYKYLPLSDEQKAGMKEEEIKQWEAKAKVGLLKGDANLGNMLTSMRRAFYDSVEGAGISLSEIGLSTSKDISKRGQIVIDEIKLKAAIETRGEQVTNLFTKESTKHPSYSPDATISERKERNDEQGIFQRIKDVLEDYTGTKTNKSGKKGIFLEKAGVKGDGTEFSSLLSADIIKKDAKISEMIKSLAARENSFYLKFSKLETAMNKLNSQSSWLSQQLGGGQ